LMGGIGMIPGVGTAPPIAGRRDSLGGFGPSRMGGMSQGEGPLHSGASLQDALNPTPEAFERAIGQQPGAPQGDPAGMRSFMPNFQGGGMGGFPQNPGAHFQNQFQQKSDQIRKMIESYKNGDFKKRFAGFSDPNKSKWDKINLALRMRP
jgi:hypothetical protein